jgi:magnesium chelatase subunit I
MGDRGTGKSTTIRAIADLLPEIEVVKMIRLTHISLT